MDGGAFTDGQRAELVGLLGECAGAAHPLHRRRVFELESASRDAAQDYDRLRAGEFDRLRRVREKHAPRIDRAISDLRSALTEPEIISELGDYGPNLLRDVMAELDRLERATEFIRHRNSPEFDIKSESSTGDPWSGNLARSIFDRYLIFACFILYQSTGKPIRYSKNEPRNGEGPPERRYFLIATEPILAHFNAARCGGLVVSVSWPTIADRLTALDVRKEPLLGGGR